MAQTDPYSGTATATSGQGDALSRQPTVFDYSQQSQFKVFLPLFPTTEWFVVRANVPGVSMGQAVQTTPLLDMPIIGDKLTYDDFYVTFLVDEELKNYTEMHDWLVNCAAPQVRSQFRGKERPAGIPKRPQTEIMDLILGNVKESDRDLYSNLDLFIMSSKNNPVVKIQMVEAFPISLTNIEYSHQESDVTYAECTATFAFSYFTISAIG
jgi:hypothetical protein